MRVPCTESALESGQEARPLLYDRVNHQGILNQHCSGSNGGSVLYILTQFLSNRSQHVMADSCRSKLVNVVSGVPQASVLGLL